MFAIILVSSRSPKRVANSFLASLLFVLCFQMVVILMERLVWDFETVSPYLCLFGFAYGPLLYLYTKALIYEDLKISTSTAYHGIPLGVMTISSLIGFSLCPKFGSLLYVSLIAYSAVSIRDIIKYRKVVKQTQSTISEMNLSWLQWTLILFTVTFLVDIYQHFYQDIDVIPGVSLVNLSLLVLINGMFYKGLKQPMIFQGITTEDERIAIRLETDPEDQELIKAQLESIQTYMQTEEPFKDSGLTLNELAKQIDLPPRRLSNLINRYLRQNFIDFINTYRIDLAKERLLNPTDPKETILEVMYEVGFNSKSSFNTLFRQKTGQTPTAFKKSVR